MTLRIAFLTNELAWPGTATGGLGSYLVRIAHALREQGGEPEIFVTGRHPRGVQDLQGIRVEEVRTSTELWLRFVRRLTRGPLDGPWGGPHLQLATAVALARALERRHAEQPFHIVQSANVGATGLFVRRVPSRVHLLRLSSHRELWFEADGLRGTSGERLMCRLEAACARRADVVYAPSRYLAEHCSSAWQLPVAVVRPPQRLEAAAVGAVRGLPPRYFLHYGQLNARKGSDVVARALVHAWREEPAIAMLWAGRLHDPTDLERYRGWWGAAANRVTWLGALGKPELYAVLQRAEASVLPSRVDNLPNTVIESLTFGVPVIGSRGASIDELVEPGCNGWLVPVGDAVALAEVLVRAWRGEAASLRSAFREPALFAEMRPEVAARSLLQLAGVTNFEL